jgi:hypothetical protein
VPIYVIARRIWASIETLSCGLFVFFHGQGIEYRSMIAVRRFANLKWSFLLAPLAIVLLASIIVTKHLSFKPSDVSADRPESEPAVTQGSTAEILIQYKGPVPEIEKQRIRDQASVTLIREIDTSYAQIDVVRPKTADDAAVSRAIQEISRNPNVQFAEVQSIYNHEPNPR